MEKKPKLIIEQKYGDVCRHMLIRIDTLNQVDLVLDFLYRFIKMSKTKAILKHDLRDIFVFGKRVYSSNRVQENSINIDYLVIDEGKKAHTAQIYLNLTYPKKYSKKIEDFDVENYFQW